MSKVSVVHVISYIAVLIGWASNLYQLFVNHYSAMYFVLKVVGILFAPLGVVLGWVGLL